MPSNPKASHRPFRFTTGPGPKQRHFSANRLGIARLINASKFIARFFPVEWKLCVLTDPERYLINVNPGELPKLYEYDETFANLVYNALLRVTRSACCLITGQSPMVVPGSGFSFIEEFPQDRLQEIGGFPEYIVNINLDGPEHNLLHGTYTKNDALVRCRALTRNCHDIILFLNRAHNLKGDKHDPNDRWDLSRVLLPANNQKVNACIPGAAKIFTPEQWAEITKSVTVNDGEDSTVSSDDDLNRPTPPPRPNAPPPTSPVIPDIIVPASPTVPEPPAPTPVNNTCEELGTPDLGKFFNTDEPPVTTVNPVDTLTNNSDNSATDPIINSVANTVTNVSTNGSDSGDHLIAGGDPHDELIYVDDPVDPEVIDAHSRYIAAQEFIPLVNGKPVHEDCPCGLYNDLLDAFAYGRSRDDYFQANGNNINNPIDVDCEDSNHPSSFHVQPTIGDVGASTSGGVISEEIMDNGREDITSRALIPHPVYGKDAQNALVKYSPHLPNLFLSN